MEQEKLTEDFKLSRLVDSFILRTCKNLAAVKFANKFSDPKSLGKEICAVANLALMQGQDHAYVIFGVDPKTFELSGVSCKTHLKLADGTPSSLCFASSFTPKLSLDYQEFTYQDTQKEALDNLKKLAILKISTPNSPVAFDLTRYYLLDGKIINLNSNIELERTLWDKSSFKSYFEQVAKDNLTCEKIFEHLNVDALYKLLNKEHPDSLAQCLKDLKDEHCVVEENKGLAITNLGVILLGKNLISYPSTGLNFVKIIIHEGETRLFSSSSEIRFVKGYASGFEELINTIYREIPSGQIINLETGRRNLNPRLPREALKEILAYVLTFQDFSQNRELLVEIFHDRLEIICQGLTEITDLNFLNLNLECHNKALHDFFVRCKLQDPTACVFHKLEAYLEQNHNPSFTVDVLLNALKLPPSYDGGFSWTRKWLSDEVESHHFS